MSQPFEDRGGMTAVSSPLSDRVRSLRLPAKQAAARTRHAWIPWTLCAILTATSAVLGFRLHELSNSTVAATDASGTSAASAKETTKPGPVVESGSVVLESKGYIIPAHQILVSPKVSGMVESLRFEEGMRVKKDDVLAVLETDDYDADFARATAAVEMQKHRLAELERGFRPEEIQQARAELDEAKAQVAQLLTEYHRNQQLRERGALALKEYEVSESAYKAMSARVERLANAFTLIEQGPRIERINVARAELRLSEADLSKAKWRLDNCTIRAPVSGTILRKNAEEGNVVNPIAFNGSFSLCDMADLSDMEVDLSIQERDVSRVFKGQRCIVRAEAFPERPYQGEVARLMPIADRAKGAIPVRVKLRIPADEEGVYLKPEMGAIVTFLKAEDVQETPRAGTSRAPEQAPNSLGKEAARQRS